MYYLTGNYEEGFGKERYKNKWNGPNSKLEITAGGQTVVAAKEPPTDTSSSLPVDSESGNSST